MAKRTLTLLLIGLIAPLVYAARAQSKEVRNMDKVRVRYMVNDLDPAVEFYTANQGFRITKEARPNFAMLDGRTPEPGGWNHIIINVDDLKSEVARLRQAHLHFHNDIVSGPGGSEILLEDPSGNPIELFQPGR